MTSLGHDASVAVIERDQILFAGHAERYSRVKNDGMVNRELLDDALQGARPSRIVYYERPWLKNARYAYAGQWDAIRETPSLSGHLAELGLGDIPVTRVGHHESHAAGGYFTSGFDSAAILVCDAIGEFDTISLWKGKGDHIRKVWSQHYPHSLGLFYSAFTQRIGHKPNEEEYIMMGMAALGKPRLVDLITSEIIEPRRAGEFPEFRLRRNVHRGIRDWHPEITEMADIAASVQQITEDYLVELCRYITGLTGERNLVLMGGVALNCVANSRIITETDFNKIWIMPNPGDAGSSIGAVAAYRRRPLDWKSAYLGHDINRALADYQAVQSLLRGDVIGIANGRAEFGPRSLGNRSLITDPRGPTTKDRVNAIKRREPFRPFAPIIMAEHAADHFEMPVAHTPYMQFVARVKRPDLFPAITHYDGTARVQTLRREDNPKFYELLERWYAETGCPMLLNTSLNLKGEPLVNTIEDAKRFRQQHGIEVF